MHMQALDLQALPAEDVLITVLETITSSVSGHP